MFDVIGGSDFGKINQQRARKPSVDPYNWGVETRQDVQARRATWRRRPTLIEHALAVVRVDFPPERRRPHRLWFAVATVASIVGSLAADVVLVTIGTNLFPSTKGYAHFRFSDDATLTVIGVVLACVAWLTVNWVSSSPRWLFLRLTVLVTLLLLVPDLLILGKGQPVRAVLVLMAMQLAIAVVTYNVLVHVAPATRRFRRADSPSSW